MWSRRPKVRLNQRSPPSVDKARGPEAGALPHKAVAAAQQVTVEGHSMGLGALGPQCSLIIPVRCPPLKVRRKSSGLCTTSTLVPRGSVPSLRSLALN